MRIKLSIGGSSLKCLVWELIRIMMFSISCRTTSKNCYCGGCMRTTWNTLVKLTFHTNILREKTIFELQEMKTYLSQKEQKAGKEAYLTDVCSAQNGKNFLIIQLKTFDFFKELPSFFFLKRWYLAYYLHVLFIQFCNKYWIHVYFKFWILISR